MSKKTIYFDSYCNYIISVVTENGKVTEFNFEKLQKNCAVGNIYKGKVEKILPGMEAIFVNCGLERNCFLSTDEVLPDSENYEMGECSDFISDLKEGDDIIVQVVKLPVGKKGAKVTAHPSFVGKCLIYLPETPFIGVSRKIADSELRHNLAYSAKRLKEENEGLVVRTAAPYAKRNQLKEEYEYLKNLYKELKEKSADAATGELLYKDSSLPVRVLRDTLSTDIDKIIVGEKRLKEHVQNLVNLYPAITKRPVILHDTGRDMLEETGISKQILSITSPKVYLDNGAYLVIEKTEALTVIDVNTGKFTGDYNLEQTVYHTNILAAREIARQVRLRNIGGIIVVDFIDMNENAHNKALVEELEKALKSDRAKCSVSSMSKFGLVEFTRKRMGASPLPFMIKPCKYCGESGNTLTAEYILLGMRARILAITSDGFKRIKLDMNREIMEKLLVWDELLADLKNSGAEIFCVPHRTYHEELIHYSTDNFALPDDAVKIT